MVLVLWFTLVTVDKYSTPLTLNDTLPPYSSRTLLLSISLLSTMCFGGNLATLSVHHFNAQLTSYWNNAKRCFESIQDELSTILDASSEMSDQSRHIRAFRQFQYHGKAPQESILSAEDCFFFAIFNTPTLDFLCNHEAILTLRLERGHVNTNFNDAMTTEKTALW